MPLDTRKNNKFSDIKFNDIIRVLIFWKKEKLFFY